jgi:hypothetical protein
MSCETLEQGNRSFTEDGTVEVWLAYSQKRFDEVSKRIDDFRSWGRQLIAWIGVLIGLEVNILPKAGASLSLLRGSPAYWPLVVLIGALLLTQLILLTRSCLVGYRTTAILSPEAPSALVPHVQDANRTEAQRMMAAYFAKSYDSHYERAEKLSKTLNGITAWLVVTIWVFAIVFVSLILIR